MKPEICATCRYFEPKTAGLGLCRNSKSPFFYYTPNRAYAIKVRNKNSCPEWTGDRPAPRWLIWINKALAALNRWLDRKLQERR